MKSRKIKSECLLHKMTIKAQAPETPQFFCYSEPIYELAVLEVSAHTNIFGKKNINC